ncbi:MAG: hypothetical protein HYT15_04095 [Candidatus Magasanikbacteria bacterium]|nr:hypothetical protein [Candidatus Magasanikbacteria bacterium]
MHEEQVVQPDQECRAKLCLVQLTLKQKGVRGISVLLGLQDAGKIKLSPGKCEIYNRVFFLSSEILGEDIRTTVVQLGSGYTTGPAKLFLLYYIQF